MPGEYRFGQVTVACEGYSYPDDAYILKGSCGVSGLGERKKDRQKQRKREREREGERERRKERNRVDNELKEERIKTKERIDYLEKCLKRS